MVTENNLSTEAVFKNKILIQLYIQPQFNILHKQYFNLYFRCQRRSQKRKKAVIRNCLTTQQKCFIVSL